jgi:hypothetical protein
MKTGVILRDPQITVSAVHSLGLSHVSAPAVSSFRSVERAGDAGDGAEHRIEDHPHFKLQIRHNFRMVAGDAEDISRSRAANMRGHNSSSYGHPPHHPHMRLSLIFASV